MSAATPSAGERGMAHYRQLCGQPPESGTCPKETTVVGWPDATLPDAARLSKSECLERYSQNRATAFFHFEAEGPDLRAGATTELLTGGAMQIFIPSEVTPQEAIAVFRHAIRWLEKEPELIAQTMSGDILDWLLREPEAASTKQIAECVERPFAVMVWKSDGVTTHEHSRHASREDAAAVVDALERPGCSAHIIEVPA